MSGIFDVLNAVNRIFEKPAVYYRNGSDDGIEIKVSKEDSSVLSQSPTDLPLSFRSATWSLDASDLEDDSGVFKPARGDRFAVDGQLWRIVAQDGVTWTDRFVGDSTRILIYTELVGA